MIISNEIYSESITIAETLFRDGISDWFTCEYDETYNTFTLFDNLPENENQTEYSGGDLLEVFDKAYFSIPTSILKEYGIVWYTNLNI